MPEATSNHTRVPTRRQFSQWMGAATAGAGAAAVAVPVTALAAPAVAMSAAHEPVVDHRAILARVEQIVDLLRTRYVCDGWKMDEEGAARALDYFRRHVDGPAFKNEDEDTAAYYHGPLEFFGSHGQSLDWIHDGNPAGLICGLAKSSSRADDLAADRANADPVIATGRGLGT